MDAFAITGVSPDHDWFLVQAAVGGVESRARLFPRVHVLRSTDIADLASGGRQIYFQQSEPRNSALVPLARGAATAFDAAHLPIEEVSRFAFLESATDYDIRCLLAVRNGTLPEVIGFDAIDRLESLDWIDRDDDGDYRLTPIGRELLRYRLD